MRTVAKRSIQTIEFRTQIVSSFVDSDTSTEFFVRRLSDRESSNRQLFIVTIDHDVNNGDVIPFAEITMTNDKMRYVVKPSHQYPDLADIHVLDKIETAISIYMKKFINNYNYH